MNLFLLVVFSFFTSLHMFLYWRLLAAMGKGKWCWVFWCFSICVMALPFLFHPRIEGLRSLFNSSRVSELIFAGSFTWVALVGIACLAFLATDVFRLAMWTVGSLTGNAALQKFSAAHFLRAALLLCVALWGYSAFEAWNIRRVDVSLVTDKLPQGVDRLRIVQVSDIHLGGFFGYSRLARVMDIVRGSSPDIFVSTGDLVDGDMAGREKEAELLASHGAGKGAFAITGNHEFYAGLEQALRFLEQSDFQILRNRRVEAGGIIVAGVDDPGFNMRDKETNLLKNLPKNRFVLFLRHRPYVMPSSEGRFDLQLSGHVHGGQIWPFRYVVEWMNKHTPGLSTRGSSAVYVSNGTGFWGPPLRFFAPPEVTVIDLIRSKS